MIPGKKSEITRLDVDGVLFYFERSETQCYFGEGIFRRDYLIQITVSDLHKREPTYQRTGQKTSEFVRMEIVRADHKENLHQTGSPTLFSESLPKKAQKWSPEAIGRLALLRAELWWQGVYIGLAHSL